MARQRTPGNGIPGVGIPGATPGAPIPKVRTLRSETAWTGALRRATGPALAGLLLFTAACGDSDEQIANSVSSAGDELEGTDADASEDAGAEGTNEDETAEDAEWARAECEDGPDRTVTPLEPVVVPAVSFEGMEVAPVTADGLESSGFTVPEVDQAETTIDTGCIIEYDAPGGCLGKVVVTGVEIPERELPGYGVPDVVDGEGNVLEEGWTADPVTLEAVTIPGFVIDEVCQIEPDEGSGGTVWGVTRWGETRWGETQWGETQWGATRWSVCADGSRIGDPCAETVATPARSLEAVSVPAVSVEAKVLPTYQLEGTDTEVVEEEDQTAYLAPADVLFEFDEAELTDEAIPTLEAIVEAIEADFEGDFTVSVEGHTDSRGEEDYNQGLSEDRADAVARRLTEHGGITESVITTVGYGETLPVAPNENEDGSDNEEGRARNRRVVITVSHE